MLMRAALRSGAGLTCLLAAAAAVATPPAGPAPPPQSPEVMLYVSWPVGAGSRGTLPKFGLRLGQARMGGNSGNPLAIGDPMRHREFLRLEISGRQDVSALDRHALDMRVRFAGRLTYDINHGVFGLHAESRGLPALLPPKRTVPHSASVAVDRSAAGGNPEKRQWRDAGDRLSKPRPVLLK
jgi:hypothetical protein